jgi:protein PhnA
MTKLPNCPKCNSEYTYEDRDHLACPECGHEWNPEAEAAESAEAASDTFEVRDAYGNLLQDGDTVTLIKDLRVKGASAPLKVGTRVRNIRLVDSDHNIDCRIEGVGAMALKSEFVKKA